MSHPAPHPDRWLPAHITGDVFADPFDADARTVRRVEAEVLLPEAADDVIDLIAIEEAELAEQIRAARLQAAMDAYAEGAEIVPNARRVTRYSLDVCEHGRLRRRALAAGGAL